jgi:uncharacterized OsmC-like protein
VEETMAMIDATTLRAMQAPLKERYRADAESARTPLHAAAWFEKDDEGVISCTVQGWSGPVRAGLHRATGGDGQDACSGDMLLEALLACAGVTLRSVATSLGVEVRGASLRADAVFDARGTLGVSRDVPAGVQEARIIADLDTDADDATLTRLAELTERYCVVGQSLRDPVRIEVRRAS